MTRSGLVGGCAAMLLATTAQAQNAAKAFECNMPYRDAVTSLAGLEVASQTPIDAIPALHGAGDLITFKTASASVYGVQPQSLSLRLLSPGTLKMSQKYVFEFKAVFLNEPATDEAIQKAAQWHLGCGAAPYCIRSQTGTPPGAGRLEYRHEYDVRDATLQCIYEFTPEEFEALGQ